MSPCHSLTDTGLNWQLKPRYQHQPRINIPNLGSDPLSSEADVSTGGPTGVRYGAQQLFHRRPGGKQTSELRSEFVGNSLSSLQW